MRAGCLDALLDTFTVFGVLSPDQPGCMMKVRDWGAGRCEALSQGREGGDRMNMTDCDKLEGCILNRRPG